MSTTPTPKKKARDHPDGHATLPAGSKTIAIDHVDEIYDIAHALEAFALFLRDAPNGNESMYHLIQPHVERLMAISDEMNGLTTAVGRHVYRRCGDEEY